MNKKVSTLVAGFLIGGSVFAMAADGKITFPLGEQLNSVKDGDKVVLLQNIGTTTNKPVTFGVLKNEAGKSEASAISANAQVNEADVLNYTWTVKVSESDADEYPTYTFVNVITGDTLSFDKANSNEMIFADKATKKYAKDGYYSLVFGGTPTAYDGTPKQLFAKAKVTEETPTNKLVVKADEVQNKVALVNNPNGTDNIQITLWSLDNSAVTDQDLNELYNRQGFSFEMKDDKIENIFNQKVYAHKSAGKTIDASKELSFPVGTYFFTDLVLVDESKAVSDDNIDWLASTFIVVSSSETKETTKVDKEAGNGYVFVTKKGSELNTYRGATEELKSDGTQIPVCNASFEVVKSYTGDYPYALKLSTFRYLLPTKEDSKNHNEKTNMFIGVTEISDVNYLATKAAATDYEYIFKKAQSTIIKGIDLLKTDGTAAVYNIKFVSGQGEDSEYNKYLTVGVEESAYTWIAEGSVLADKNAPEYQFVVTSVDKNNNVTFTNRETGEEITIQLFNENNCYSVAAAAVDAATTVQAVTIDSNTYAVNKGKVVNLDASLIVLEKVETVDDKAGFLDVADKSIMTLAYARDNNTTSNKYYTVVKDTNGTYSFTNNNEAVTTELADAAQFQLVKAEKPLTLKRSYVYNENGSVTLKANADVINVYPYALQYITDGTETKAFLKGDAANGWAIDNNTTVDAAWKCLIKEHKDGSVSLVYIDANTGLTGVDVLDVSKKSAGAMNINSTGIVSFSNGEIYPIEVKENSLKTYLLSEAPEISWKAETGHVTIQSELSNYISMNDKHEGIVVNESAETFYLHVTDKEAVVPSFYISQGIGESSNGESKRLFLFNPTDSVDYQVNQKWDPDYQWTENRTKAIFKEGRLVAADTMETVVKGNLVNVSKKQNNTDGTLKGIERFKYQIVETPEADGYFYIRQVNGEANAKYLASWNEMLTWSGKADAMKFTIKDAEGPTSNENVAASEVKVIAANGSINVKNAAGKNVVVSTILGQVVANEVLTSDNATINVPAGIVVVSVEGESFKVNVK